ncbi:hypothetical protein DPMN_171136 [Dreissena polymorpha]|uniref:Uncharacterized protein n=1 Tax=Dreissena polymorpha TaxID=45954 RepID=A0A9D4DZW1_DREPO|nr:hypothetical protein DPMN_171136 [Dreissena polymorpha]
MQLNKLIAKRDGHRRLISRELEKFDSTELTTSEFERLLHMIVEEAEEVRTLNDKIATITISKIYHRNWSGENHIHLT